MFIKSKPQFPLLKTNHFPEQSVSKDQTFLTIISVNIVIKKAIIILAYQCHNFDDVGLWPLRDIVVSVVTKDQVITLCVREKRFD